jgi:uncharacterized repeat protein (TIGR02543 family)
MPLKDVVGNGDQTIVTVGSNGIILTASSTECSLIYDGNGATSGIVPTDSNIYQSGDTVTVLDNTGELRKTSYLFDGWNTAEDGSGTAYNNADTFDITKDTVLYAQWSSILPDLNSTDHFKYIFGYSDGSVRPEESITRAEVATIFYRLLTATRRDKIFTDTNNFSDVTSAAWYNKAVSSLAAGGYLQGYCDGSFCGDFLITRAEFITIAARFVADVRAETVSLSDVSTDCWAYDSIATAEHYEWVTGYTDGTFQPDAPITRAEVMTIINRMLNRGVDETGVATTGFAALPDNDSSKWYYYEVIEAVNDHEYTGTRPSEVWSSLTTSYTYDMVYYEQP